MPRSIRQRLLGHKAEKQTASTVIRPATSSLQTTQDPTTVQNHDIQHQSSFQQEVPQPNPEHPQDDAHAGQSNPANGLEPPVSV